MADEGVGVGVCPLHGEYYLDAEDSPCPSCEDEGTLLADGFDKALIGVGRQFNRTLAIYSYEKCVEILVSRDGMTREGAVEFMEYNVLGAWVGEHTPVFMEARHE